MSDRPMVRAGACQDAYRFAESLKPGEVRSRLPASVLEYYEHRARTDWVPAEIDLEFLAAVQQVFGGPAGLRDVFRRSISRHLDSPLLRAGVESAVRLFGPTPGALLGFWPRFQPSFFRGFGTVRVEKVENACSVIHEGGPPEMFRGGLYVTSWEGLMVGACDFVRARDARVSSRSVPERGMATIDVSWSPR